MSPTDSVLQCAIVHIPEKIQKNNESILQHKVTKSRKIKLDVQVFAKKHSILTSDRLIFIKPNRKFVSCNKSCFT